MPDYYGARSDTALAIYDAKTRELKRVISGPAGTLDEPVSIGKDEIAYAVIEIPGEPLVLPVLRPQPRYPRPYGSCGYHDWCGPEGKAACVKCGIPFYGPL